LGGDWNNGANAGSRASNWNNSPWNANANIGARGRCDDRFRLCVGYGRAGRPHLVVSPIILLRRIH
jgi:hypothetical protein